MNKIINLSCVLALLTISLYSQSDSLVKRYNYQGRLIYEGHILNGKKTGSWKFYNDSLGYLTKAENYINDYPDGEFTEYNSSGVVILRGNHSLNAIKHYKKKEKQFGGVVYTYKALPVGELLYYDDKGLLIKREFYNKKGKLLKSEVIK